MRPRVSAVKTAFLKESRRIAERRDGGVIDRDAHNMPLRPLSNESINKRLALLARILDDAVERGYLGDNAARRGQASAPSSPSPTGPGAA